MSITGRPAADRTVEMWTEAVLRSIGTMREHLGEELPLRTLAESAWLSPFHFHRVFHRLTDSTPARFLAAWRIAEAKRRLAYGSESVSDICRLIGYASLGTFTSQFTRVVGISPARFRRLLRDHADVPFHEILERLEQTAPAPASATLRVTVTGGPDDGAPAAVGVFDSGIPQGRPAACAVVRTPGTARLAPPPDRGWQPLAMCFDRSVTVQEAVGLSDTDHAYVAIAPPPFRSTDGDPDAPVTVHLRLRRRQPTDPPILLALPLLMAATGR